MVTRAPQGIFVPPRTATLVVAASDSSAKSKAQADYVCDGTDDQVEIQAAIDALPAGGGRVLLLEGNYSISSPILINRDNITIEGLDTSTILKPSVNTHVFSIVPPAAPIWSPIIRHLKIDDTAANQTNTAAIYLRNAAYAIWDLGLEHLYIYKVHRAIASESPTPAISLGVNRAIFRDIYIENVRWDAFFLQSFFDCVLEDIFANLSGITANLTTPNFQFVNGGLESGTWCARLRVLGRKVTYSSGLGLQIDNVRSLWLYECFMDTCGTHGYFFMNSLHRSTLLRCRAQNVKEHGFNWAGNATDEIHLYDCEALINEGWGLLSNTGDTSTKYILGGASQGNTSGALTLPTGTNIIRHLRGYVTENSGTDSIASGSTSKAVTHGLAAAPTVINIAFMEQATNDYGRWWISAIGTSTFTLNVSADPGASNLDFRWEAKVR